MMSVQHPVLVIGCDIGGVLKDQVTDAPIDDGVESVLKLSNNTSNMLIFISKCKDSYKQKSNMWLEKHNLSHIKTHYCLEYIEKVKIAHENQVKIMIDDKMQVLSNFPSSTIKIWFCSNPKNIEGARKFQPDFVNSVRIAGSWREVIELIENIRATLMDAST
jgi:uncharacterized HAD superfamily protein